VCGGFFKIMNPTELKSILNQLYSLSQKAASQKEVPVSCCLVLADGQKIYASNEVEEEDNPLSHAEMKALEEGFRKSHSRYLEGASLIVTLEPCLMCLGAILKAGIHQLYYVLDDPDLGSLSHYHVFVGKGLEIIRLEDPRFRLLMDEFFKTIRNPD
jgi:tRNA(adenine34) deaminase